MTDYSDLNARQLYELLLENITSQLNGIDRSDKVNTLKKEADKRSDQLYKNAFEEAKNRYSPQIEVVAEYDQIPKHIEVLNEKLKGTDYQLAQVIGDSMVNRDIYEGNFIMFDTRVVPKNGDVVIAKYKDQIFVKNYYKSGESVSLKSENPKYDDIEIDFENEFSILGVVNMIINNI